MKLKLIILLAAMIGVVASGFCQRLITAKIVNMDTNEPVDKAIIVKESDSIQTTTNYLGFFQLPVDSLEFLIISKEGYKTTKIKTPVQNSFLIQIEPDNLSIVNEVSTKYEKGKIVDGYRAGIWEYYDEPGQVALRIDYTTGNLLFIENDTSEYAIEFGDTYKMTYVDRQARYMGSESEFYSLLGSTIKYPQQARKSGKEGTLHVLFEVDSLGQTVNFRVINDIGGGCGDQVIEALKKVPGMWIPAVLDGEVQRSRFIIPVIYKINRSGRQAGRSSKRKNEALPVAKRLPEITVTSTSVTRTTRIIGY